MNLNEYQNLSKRTMPKHDDLSGKLANYGLGVAGEAGEVADHIKKVVFHKHKLDKEEVEKELGDVLHYVSGIAYLLDIELNDVAITNLKKLKARYPNGFSEHDSRNRAD